MPLLDSSGVSPRYSVGQNNGVHIKVSNVSGTLNIRCFDGEEDMGFTRDDSNAVINYVVDFDRVLEFRKGDRFQLVQTGGTPETTRFTVGGADG